MERAARREAGKEREPARGRGREALLALLLAGAVAKWTQGEPPGATPEVPKFPTQTAAEQRNIQNTKARLEAAQKVLLLMARECAGRSDGEVEMMELPAVDMRTHEITKEGFYPLEAEILQIAQDQETADRWQATYDSMKEKVVIEQGEGEVFMYIPGDDSFDNVYLTEISEGGTEPSLVVETADGEEREIGSIQSGTREPLTALDYKKFEEDAARWIEHGAHLSLAGVAAERAGVEIPKDI
jgi:hypothetical protein